MIKIILKNKIYQRFFASESNESVRNKALFFSAISSLGSRGISVMITMVSIPLTYNYLNSERFGVMMTIVSLVTSVSFSDFGVGFSLQNRWSLFQNNLFEQKKAVSTIFFFQLFISINLLIFALVIYRNFDISTFFKVDRSNSNLIREINISTLVFFIFTALSLPFSIVQKIQLGRQKGYLINIWNICSNISSLLLLFFLLI
jgi:O-antigen/teichoic acid export membrane protein